jgi:protein-L-isoaspartate(D-aspartate) O-methyltransferase
VKEEIGKISTSWIAPSAEMVDELKRTNYLHDDSAEAAFRSVLRHHFINRLPPESPNIEQWRNTSTWIRVIPEKPTPESLKAIYSAHKAIMSRVFPSPSSSSAPDIMAIMLEVLEAEKGMKVLEIGTGTGYNAALLAHIVGDPRKVYSVENQAVAVAEAVSNLQRAGFPEVNVVHGDGGYGYAKAAPYDRIIAAASIIDVPPTWLEQLVNDGILVAPFWVGPTMHPVVKLRKVNQGLAGRFVSGAGFMALQGEFGYNEQLEGWIHANKSGTISELLENPVGEDSSLLSDDAGNAECSPIIDSLVMFISVFGDRYLTHVQDRKRMARLSLWDKDAKSLVCVWHPDLIVSMYGNDSAYQQFCRLHEQWIQLGKPGVGSYELLMDSTERSTPIGEERVCIFTRKWNTWQIRSPEPVSNS